MFNRWKPYPKYKPLKRGWYICSIRYGEEPGQAYVMDLFWDEKEEKWKDNRRLDVYNTYEVYGYNDETHLIDKRMYKDNLCYRNDVIAFKKYQEYTDEKSILFGYQKGEYINDRNFRWKSEEVL